MKTKPNTTDAAIVGDAATSGLYWITEYGCEDVGPFPSHEGAETWYAQHIGPCGAGAYLPITEALCARKIVNTAEPLDAAADAEASGLDVAVIKAYHAAGYYIANT